MYSKVFRGIIFPVVEFTQRTKIQKYLRWLNTTQWWRREELEKLQNKGLRAIIKHAYNNVPYYHRLFKKLDLRPDDIKTKKDLQKIPVLTKEIVRRNLQDLIARNISKKKFIRAYSSGSTGEPLKYYIDKDSYSMGWAQTFRSWGWVGYELGDPYVKVSLNPRTKIIKKLQDRLMRCRFVYPAKITVNNINEYLSKMNNIKIIRGYSSAIYLISEMIEKADVSEKLIPRPNAVSTTGEILFPHWREKIENVFDCDVLDCYGGESTPVAYECPEHNGYHIAAELTIVETLRDDEVASPGEIGEVVITNLYNFAMPFIRYKLNDLAVLKDDECSCGRNLPMIDSILGRDTDIVITPDGRFLLVYFFTVLFKYIEGVNQFQVIQEKLDKLNIKIVKNEKFTNKDLERILSGIKNAAGEEMEVNIEFVDEIPVSKSGKRRFVISKVPIDHLWKKGK